MHGNKRSKLSEGIGQGHAHFKVIPRSVLVVIIRIAVALRSRSHGPGITVPPHLKCRHFWGWHAAAI